MGRLQFGTPREAWGGEAEWFTPLLAQEDLLDYLGQETGIGSLTLVETEHPTAGNRSLDILAETADGSRVAIENQYGKADHDHLTRGLAYAVATKARVLIVVAEDHGDEFISVANYLNEVGLLAENSGISVWLVQVRAVRRAGDPIWSPEFVVQAQPNEWAARVARDTATLSSLDEFYRKCAEATDPRWAETAQAIITEWLERPGANEDHNTKTHVGLYLQSPRNQNRGTNVLQLYVRGAVTVCRDYIWKTSGAFDPAQEPGELDQQIRALFPKAHWPPKQAFISDHDASPEVVARFGDWLQARFAGN
jgi:hypothetical protein